MENSTICMYIRKSVDNWYLSVKITGNVKHQLSHINYVVNYEIHGHIYEKGGFRHGFQKMYPIAR